ncbi:hypothetical protein PhCBS80983_g01651 [Powellomyces hirtus]|uniref:Uncharacterized protein n=1 Tax=Powellomyces hirtus TaxID=109895 RepID=A0A507ECC0_9FUNG|nr:hypothetical protein PhCBS80983_g01651 [Powellomyces hirtus]
MGPPSIPLQPDANGTTTPDSKSCSTVTGADPPPHFGDIMSSRETSVLIPEGYTPLERILLTANGNVQRILSAYHNAKVTVEILKNELASSLDDVPAIFHRKVLLIIKGKTCCTANSTVIIRDEKYLRLLVDQHVGIGQLFRYLNILPEFALTKVGRDPAGNGFWRKYTLSSPGIVCEIHEDFPPHVFELDNGASP